MKNWASKHNQQLTNREQAQLFLRDRLRYMQSSGMKFTKQHVAILKGHLHVDRSAAASQ